MTENQWPQDEDLTTPPVTQNPAYDPSTTGYGETGAGTAGYGTTGAGTAGYPGTTGYQDEGSSKKDVAKDEAANVAGQAAGAAQNVAETAKTEAKNVAYEAKNSAKDLLHQAKSDLTDQAGTQQAKAAEGIRTISSQLRTMADAPDQQGVAADLIRQAADRSESVASWLDNRDPGSLLNEVKSFARQRPGTFLLLAAGAGLVAGRLGRSLQAGAPETGTPTGYGSTAGAVPPYPAQPPATEGSLDAGSEHRSMTTPNWASLPTRSRPTVNPLMENSPPASRRTAHRRSESRLTANPPRDNPPMPNPPTASRRSVSRRMTSQSMASRRGGILMTLRVGGVPCEQPDTRCPAYGRARQGRHHLPR